MAVWNPWRGCRKYSEGCSFCYIHKGDSRKGIVTSDIVRTNQFYSPAAKNKSGEYKMKSGQTVYVCFSSDFLIKEADEWRKECWKMIKERSDLHFLFLTKRIDRFAECIPEDWDDGYGNVTVGCTAENQEQADYRLSIFSQLPIRHKNIICQPMIGKISVEKYLNGIELVVAGGESDRNGRVLDYDWVLSLREECRRNNVRFQFRQCGTHFVKDGRKYTINVRNLASQAKKAGIDL